ncbi:MAG: c-type cytochrome [Vicinamibacterales bacterium]|nr:c-type cytochrome [Vicinamibacterales bacterium]
MVNESSHLPRRVRRWSCAAFACAMVWCVPTAARAGQDGLVNPHEGSPAATRAGRALFATRCAECHGADAKGISGPDLTELWAVGSADQRTFQTIRAGISGSIMPSSAAPDDELWAIVTYLRSIGTASPVEFATGDADRGREIFQSNCARCHRVAGRGGRLGPELSRITVTRSRASLTQAIRDPGASMAVGYRTVTLVTRDGDEIRGVKKSADAFSVQVVDTDERLQGYLRADLRDVRDETSSLMPAFGVDRLSDGDLDDLLRFLASMREADAAP